MMNFKDKKMKKGISTIIVVILLASMVLSMAAGKVSAI